MNKEKWIIELIKTAPKHTLCKMYAEATEKKAWKVYEQYKINELRNWLLTNYKKLFC